MPEQSVSSGGPVTATPGAPDPGMEELHGQLESDLGQEQEAISTRDSAYDRFLSTAGNFNPDAAAGPQPMFDQPAPQEHFNEIMQQAPLLMGLAAIGGSLGHQHGMTMLQSTNAMMKGIVSGSKQQYEDARKNYDESYQQFLDKQKTWMDVYKAYSTAYKGNVDAQLRAVTAANTAVGVAQRDVKMDRTQIAQMNTLTQKIREQHDKVSMFNSKLDVDQQRADAATLNAESSATRANTGVATEARKGAAAGKNAAASDASTKQLLGTIKELKTMIKNHNAMTGLAGAGRRAVEWGASATGISDDVPATQFNSKLNLLISKVPEILKVKGKMGKDQREKIDAAVNDLKLTSGRQMEVKLNELEELLGEAGNPAELETKTINGKTYVKRAGQWYQQ